MKFLTLPILLFLGACTPEIKDNIASNWEQFKAYSFSEPIIEMSGAPNVMKANGWHARDISLYEGRTATKLSAKGRAVAGQCQPVWENRYIEVNGYWHIERQKTGCQ